MFKKSLAAIAVLGTISVSAMAANFQLYGAVDTGFTYTHSGDSLTAENKFEMNSGNYAGSRFGLRGTEDLGDDLKVGFILENGFASDTGVLGQNGGIFGRESQLYVKGNWGTIGFGRFGAFSSGSSSMSWYWDMEPFETGYTDAGIQATQMNAWRLNSNAIYYVSPVISGIKFGVQHSFTGTDDKESQKFDDNNTFTNIAVRWDGANAKAILGFEMERFGYIPTDENNTKKYNKQRDNAYNVKLAGAWTPNGGPATIFVGMSWFKNYDKFSDSTWDDDEKIQFDPNSGKRLQGYSAFLGGRYTIGQADLLAMVQYMDGENKAAQANAEKDYKRYVGSIGCHYHFSKRTMLYAVASYADGDGIFETIQDAKTTNRFMTHLGLTHFF